MVLGELEKQVLNYLWHNREADAKQIHAAFERSRGGSLNTIQSTLDRLFKKSLLTREKCGHAYLYRPSLEREHLVARLIESVTSDFAVDGESPMFAAFASMSESLDDQELDRLEALIEARRARRQQDDAG